MADFGFNWGAWQATALAASAVGNGSTGVTGAISNHGKAATEVSVEVAYGNPASAGVIPYVLGETDGTPSYEAAADGAYSPGALAATASTTHRRRFVVPGDQLGGFKILVSNPSGASVTATVRYRQATLSQQ